MGQTLQLAKSMLQENSLKQIERDCTTVNARLGNMLQFNQKLARKRRQVQLNEKYQTMFLNMWVVGCILMFARAYFVDADYFGLDSTPL